MEQIQDTTLSDLILRDTDTTAIQADAFVATERHASNLASPDPTEPQLVIGVDANSAVIAGSPGVENTIVAGSGANQILTGGGSSDVFTLLGSGHHDTVTDFNLKVDKIDFEGLFRAASFRDLIIHGNSARRRGRRVCRQLDDFNGPPFGVALRTKLPIQPGQSCPGSRRRTLTSAPDGDIGTVRVRGSVDWTRQVAQSRQVSRSPRLRHLTRPRQLDGVCEQPEASGRA